MNVVLHLMRVFQLKNDIVFTQKSRIVHVRNAIRRLRNALGLMVMAVLMGTLGYRIIEHVAWFDAYYMSLVTLSTVGFGEVISLSHNGRVFTSLLILFNIGFFAYAISTITSIFADSDIHSFFSDLKMMQRIQKLQQHTIVCGYGRHAGEVCKELAKQNTPFVVIELDPEKIEILGRDTNYLFLRGDATLDEVLIEAGIARAAALIVTLPADSNNLFVVISARQLNPALKIISRLNNPADKAKLKRAGANHVVMPEQIGGFYMATLVKNPDLVEFYGLISNLGPSDFVFEEIPVAQLKKQFQAQSMAESGFLSTSPIPVLGIRYADGQYQLHPPAHTVLQPDMHMLLLGNAGQLKQFCSLTLQSSTVETEA